ncbi:hypothetical protein AMYX_09160 [Anaeromyxobacter diazotrophicus]|uniref:Peptidase C45 acyl-coenzyme A:6-aminopenicillanic acid acyl-transferase n=1 Tax=Anaeromyxobacter diazotrophicus TaxID=2590199 RepID=A0A7I9VII3_9BACT|nr:hypothetical protein AMYX_09160 [Anaeromyxobacter diazotrophicus]
MPLTLLDADARDGWAAALGGSREAVRALLDGFDAQARAQAAAQLGPLGGPALCALRALQDLLHRARGRRHGAELDRVAALAGRAPAEVLLANLAYEHGCSTFLRDGPGGPLHARNLDWPFPGGLLRRHGCVLRVHGAPAGGYAVVGWPGLLGALTAVAPGRFTVSVNYVRHRRGGLARLLARAAGGALPVAWAVREALERSGSFADAVERLRAAPLLAPALLALAGPRRGEAVVVERTPRGGALRRLEEGALSVANHYEAAGLAGQCVDYDAGGSAARKAILVRGLARAAPRDARAALWLLAPAVRPETQQQAVMRAGDGLLVVRAPGERARRIDLSPLGAPRPPRRSPAGPRSRGRRRDGAR